ncbi:uncharacterized protein LOC100185263 isoform X2 [Ciona intestinalis]
MEDQSVTNNSELNAYTVIARNILNKFDAQLEWSSPTRDEIQCPINRNHVLTLAKYNEHVAKCKWKKHGYSDHEVKDIINEENSDFPFPLVQIGLEKITELDFRKNMRDHKRRRQTYRAKNVHITKRSQTEIVRDVLKIHMEELKLAWSNKSVSDTTTDERQTCDKSGIISHEHSSRDCDKRERSDSSTTHKRNRSRNDAREDSDHNREKSTAVKSHDRESDFREKRDETSHYKHHSHSDTHENRDHKHERSHERVYKSSKKSKRRDFSPDSRRHKHHKKEKKHHKESSRKRKLSSDRELKRSW